MTDQTTEEVVESAEVRIGPAATRFTRIFSAPKSRARYLQVDSSAALATPIQSYFGQATVASKSKLRRSSM